MVDQTNHIIQVESEIDSIVSLVPSQTEMLSYFGLDVETVGITKFCIHPKEWYNSKKRIGGTKNIDIEKIRALNPNLIIANKEENVASDIELLRADFTVYTSDVVTLESAYQMMADVGKLTNRIDKASALIHKIKAGFASLPQINKTVLYLIWKDPYMAAGTETFINAMLQSIGLDNCHQKNKRYDEIGLSEIQTLNPDYIFLSSEPYPFKEKHIAELETKTNSKVILVDGEKFSWYGSRMLSFKSYIENELLSKLK
ncbi:MAG: helical backbone metal receptor [Putridiphycobacter sp.]|nr:helical backbone metal receptor [Putridiphycobacter sp.]